MLIVMEMIRWKGGDVMDNVLKRLLVFLAFIVFMIGTVFTDTSHRSVEAMIHHSPCWHCGGTGKCPSCHGEGRIIIHEPINDDGYPEKTWATCRECYGDGFCNACHGSGMEE